MNPYCETETKLVLSNLQDGLDIVRADIPILLSTLYESLEDCRKFVERNKQRIEYYEGVLDAVGSTVEVEALRLSSFEWKKRAKTAENKLLKIKFLGKAIIDLSQAIAKDEDLKYHLYNVTNEWHSLPEELRSELVDERS